MEKSFKWPYALQKISWTCALGSCLLFGILGYEYHSIKQCISEVIALKLAYQARLQLLEALMSQRGTSEDADFSDRNNGIDDIFIPLNRNPSYLQACAYDLFKKERVEGLFHQVSDEWNTYAGTSIGPVNKKSVSSKASTKRTVRRTKSHGNSFLDWPIKPDLFWLSSPFGQRKNRDGTIGFHYGIDLAALKGTPVYAAAGGIVIEARYVRGYGNVVVVKHTRRISTRYAHLNSVHVKVGMRVNTGNLLGKVGETGFVRKQTKDGSHLHFEVCDNGKRVNPLPLLPAL